MLLEPEADYEQLEKQIILKNQRRDIEPNKSDQPIINISRNSHSKGFKLNEHYKSSSDFSPSAFVVSKIPKKTFRPRSSKPRV